MNLSVGLLFSPSSSSSSSSSSSKLVEYNQGNIHHQLKQQQPIGISFFTHFQFSNLSISVGARSIKLTFMRI